MKPTLLIFCLFASVILFSQEKTKMKKIDYEFVIKNLSYTGSYDGSVAKLNLDDKKKNAPHGEGVFIGKTNLDDNSEQWVYYNGNWVEGQMEGAGTFYSIVKSKGVEPNWDFIEGMIKSKSQSLMNFVNEFIVGEFRQNAPGGQCSYESQKVKYQGEMKNWLCHGQGKRIAKDTIFVASKKFIASASDGYFEYDKLVNGTIRLMTSEVLTGSWYKDLFTGEGQIPLHKKDTAFISSSPYCLNSFTGKFQNGDFGAGRMKLCNGDTLEGNWSNRLYTGDGKLNLNNDSIYISTKLLIATSYQGHFSNGDFSDGVMKFKSSDQLRGIWKNKKFTGEGIIRNLNDKITISKIDYKASSFNGTFKEGMYQDGEMTLDSEDKLSGNWTNKLFSGKTKLNVKNDSIILSSCKYPISEFDGQIEKGEYKEGEMLLNSSGSLIGNWINDFFNGKAKLIITEDTTLIASKKYSIAEFDGQFTESEYSDGRMILENGSELIGSWKDKFFSGKAKLKASDFSVFLASKPYSVSEFFGQINKGEFNEGKMILSNGDSLVGTWSKNLFSGFGDVQISDEKIELASIPFKMTEFKGRFSNGDYSEGEIMLNTGNVLKGKLRDKRFNGFGRVPLDNSFSYDGEWLNGAAHGIGRLIKINEYEFSGTFSQNKINGEGKKTSSNGTVYKGQWQGSIDKGSVTLEVLGEYSITAPNGLVCIGVNQGNRFVGKGEVILKDNSIYKGSLTLESSNIIEGNGQITFPNGDVLIVSWDENGYSGKGRLNNGFSETGDKLFSEGTFRNGLLTGNGRRGYMDAENSSYFVYQGEFKNGIMQGIGKIKVENKYAPVSLTIDGTWENNEATSGILKKEVRMDIDGGPVIKTHYEGPIKNYEPHGIGKLKDSDGTIYEGEFSEGYYNGMGVLTMSGDKYEGTFIDGTFVNGKITYKNRNIYEGECINYQPTGKGKMTLASGKVMQGNFENGEYVKPFSCKEVQIGNQIWMAENMKLITFRNGEAIPEARTIEEWVNAGENNQPAFCYVNNDPSTASSHGVLYNWHAVNDSRGFAPEGWYVPSHNEANTLRDYLMSDIITKQDKIKDLDNQGIDTHKLQDELNNMFRTSRQVLSGDEKLLPSYDKGAKYFIRKSDQFLRRDDGEFQLDHFGDYSGPSSGMGAHFWTSSVYGEEGFKMFFSETGCLNSGDNAGFEVGWYFDSWLVYQRSSSHKNNGYYVRCIKN
jgi:uncharacterized protein (TIGR02145 family)